MYLFYRAIALVAIALFGGMAFVHGIALAGSHGGNGQWAWVIGGMCAVAGSVWLFRHAGIAETRHLRDVSSRALRDGRLSARARLFAPMLAVLVFAGMLAVGALLGLEKRDWLVMALAAACAVLLLLVVFDLLRQVLRPGPMLTLDAAGVEHGAYGRIPWPQVLSLRHEERRVRATAIHVLHLKVRDPVRYLDRAPLFFRLGKRDWRRSPPAAGELPIALNVLDCPPRAVVETAMRLHARARAHAMVASTFAQLDSDAGDPPALRQPTTEEIRARRRAILTPRALGSPLLHTPNEIPAGERWSSIGLSVFLLLYGGWGVGRNDLYVPGKHGPGVHLHDGAAWLLFAAMICASAAMLSVVADHYDRRDNERHYRTFAALFRWLGWACASMSVLWFLLRA